MIIGAPLKWLPTSKKAPHLLSNILFNLHESSEPVTQAPDVSVTPQRSVTFQVLLDLSPTPRFLAPIFQSYGILFLWNTSAPYFILMEFSTLHAPNELTRGTDI